MATKLAALRQSPWLRSKYLLFAAIGLMLAYVIPHDESFLVHPKDPLWQHYEPLSGGCCHMESPVRAPCYWARCSSQTDFAIVSGNSTV